MKSIYLLGLCCLFGNAHAGLNVIADLGGEPAAPYFDGINNQPNEFESPNPPEAAVLPAAPASLASVLPISTPELTPGSVEARRLGLPGMQPIFCWVTIRCPAVGWMNERNRCGSCGPLG